MSTIEEILDRLYKDYPLELLMNKNLEERDRLEVIFKRELLEEIENILKGVSE
jgi:hypothetical protein